MRLTTSAVSAAKDRIVIRRILQKSPFRQASITTRTGHGNEFHSHPGSFWSAVYYVDDGGIDADPSLGGELEFMDPRGPLPAMNAPHLGYAMPGGLTAGATERIRPKAGRLVMFPAWMIHQVRPYQGTAERISIAFNLSL